MTENQTKRLIEIGQEDEGMMLCLIEIYKEQTPTSINQLREKAQEKQAQELKNAAHTLKGTMLNLGFNEMAELCLKIEHSAIDVNFTQAQELTNQIESKHQAMLNTLEELEKKAG